MYNFQLNLSASPPSTTISTETIVSTPRSSTGSILTGRNKRSSTVDLANTLIATMLQEPQPAPGGQPLSNLNTGQLLASSSAKMISTTSAAQPITIGRQEDGAQQVYVVKQVHMDCFY